MRTSRNPSDWIEIRRGTYQNRFNPKVFTHSLKAKTAYHIEARLFSMDDGKTFYRGGGSSKEFNIGEAPPQTEKIIIKDKEWWE